MTKNRGTELESVPEIATADGFQSATTLWHIIPRSDDEAHPVDIIFQLAPSKATTADNRQIEGGCRAFLRAAAIPPSSAVVKRLAKVITARITPEKHQQEEVLEKLKEALGEPGKIRSRSVRRTSGSPPYIG